MQELRDTAWTLLPGISQFSFIPSIGAEKTKPLWAGTSQHPLFTTKEVKFWILGFGAFCF